MMRAVGKWTGLVLLAVLVIGAGLWLFAPVEPV